MRTKDILKQKFKLIVANIKTTYTKRLTVYDKTNN